jgi:peptide/nickel transport system ATP-binding protein
MAMLLITHDMGVIAGHADRVNVMHTGRVVEVAEAPELFSDMRHPYTQALLASIPTLAQDPGTPLPTIPKLPPDLTNPPAGCRFADRCAYATETCRENEPPLTGDGRRFSCWLRSAARSPLTVTDRLGAPAAPGNAQPAPVPLLEVRDLAKEFPISAGALLRHRARSV